MRAWTSKPTGWRLSMNSPKSAVRKSRARRTRRPRRWPRHPCLSPQTRRTSVLMIYCCLNLRSWPRSPLRATSLSIRRCSVSSEPSASPRARARRTSMATSVGCSSKSLLTATPRSCGCPTSPCRPSGATPIRFHAFRPRCGSTIRGRLAKFSRPGASRWLRRRASATPRPSICS